MSNDENDLERRDWLDAELADTFDEHYELEISEPTLSLEIRNIYERNRYTAQPNAEHQHDRYHTPADIRVMSDERYCIDNQPPCQALGSIKAPRLHGSCVLRP